MAREGPTYVPVIMARDRPTYLTGLMARERPPYLPIIISREGPLQRDIIIAIVVITLVIITSLHTLVQHSTITIDKHRSIALQDLTVASSDADSSFFRLYQIGKIAQLLKDGISSPDRR
jgi:hypothetical protein